MVQCVGEFADCNQMNTLPCLTHSIKHVGKTLAGSTWWTLRKRTRSHVQGSFWDNKTIIIIENIILKTNEYCMPFLQIDTPKSYKGHVEHRENCWVFWTVSVQVYVQLKKCCLKPHGAADSFCVAFVFDTLCKFVPFWTVFLCTSDIIQWFREADAFGNPRVRR